MLSVRDAEYLLSSYTPPGHTPCTIPMTQLRLLLSQHRTSTKHTITNRKLINTFHRTTVASICWEKSKTNTCFASFYFSSCPGLCSTFYFTKNKSAENNQWGCALRGNRIIYSEYCHRVPSSISLTIFLFASYSGYFFVCSCLCFVSLSFSFVMICAWRFYGKYCSATHNESAQVNIFLSFLSLNSMEYARSAANRIDNKQRTDAERYCRSTDNNYITNESTCRSIRFARMCLQLCLALGVTKRENLIGFAANTIFSGQKTSFAAWDLAHDFYLYHWFELHTEECILTHFRTNVSHRR